MPTPPTRRTEEFEQILLGFLQALMPLLSPDGAITAQTMITNPRSMAIPIYLAGGSVGEGSGNVVISRAIPVSLVAGVSQVLNHNLGPQALIDHIYFYPIGTGAITNVAREDLIDNVTAADDKTITVNPTITATGMLAFASHINI